ncbi:MAG: Npun_F5749 family FMN-dependent PPOX-type flavoprotein [Pseudomonadota bacterium]
MALIDAPWRSSLARALHRNRAHPAARFVQLATVRPDGSPANRTIVFRGFVPEPFSRHDNLADTLQFVTDQRSEKVLELEHEGRVEICWYFVKTREQFRLRGELVIIGENASDLPEQPDVRLRQHLWKSLSDAARTQFSWPDPAGERAEDAAFEVAAPDAEQPLASFAVLLLKPTYVDHLELRAAPQNRFCYWLDEEQAWQSRRRNP